MKIQKSHFSAQETGIGKNPEMETGRYVLRTTKEYQMKKVDSSEIIFLSGVFFVCLLVFFLLIFFLLFYFFPWNSG